MPPRSALSSSQSVPLVQLVRTPDTSAPAADISDGAEPGRPFRVTEKALTLARLMVDSIGDPTGDRAWALIGPYGSGKSTFARLILSVLGETGNVWATRGLSELAAHDAEVARVLRSSRVRGAYLTVPVVGASGPLGEPLLRAAEARIAAIAPRSKGRASLRRTLASAAAGEELSHLHIVDLVRRTIDAAAQAGKRGVVLVLDEFGRFLDANPAEAARTLAIVQDLAELTRRSRDVEFHLLLILHQNFADYSGTLTAARRHDWAKVQGRFRQFAFQDDPAAHYEFIAGQLDRSTALDESVQGWARLMWADVQDLPAFSDGDRWSELVGRLYPLHPLAAYALPRIAALVGQNERTLVSFLSSEEPHALPAFLASHEVDPTRSLPTVTADWLFDFFVQGQLSASLPADLRRGLARTYAALEQVTDESGVDVRIVKAIGLMALINDRRALPLTRELVAAASGQERDLVHVHLSALVESKVLLYRDLSQEYALNPGTDIDLDAELERAAAEIPPDFDAANALNELLQLEPIVARRHSVSTGTVRSFGRAVVNPVAIPVAVRKTWRQRTEEPDGQILFVLATDADERMAASQLIHDASDPLTIVVIPEQPLRVRELVREAAALRNVLASDIVAADRIAKGELELRRAIVTATIRRELSNLLVPGAATWLRSGGRAFQPMSERDVQRCLSDICDEAFSHTPAIQNELINRRQLSSAVVVAVKKILAVLLESGTGDVALNGNRPEVSVFRTLFTDSGWYVPARGLTRPEKRGLWRDLWGVIERFLDSTASSPRTVAELWDELAAPPYGLRAGVAPLLTLAVLIANRDRVCLFENGTYLRRWSLQHYDRLVRFPENFTIRAVRPTGPISDLIGKLGALIPGMEPPAATSGPAPINVFLTRLFTWYSALPEYAQRSRSVSDSARKFHLALASASDPLTLLTDGIPNALGLPAVTERTPEIVVNQIAETFSAVVAEIESAYPALLNEAVEAFATVFGTEPAPQSLAMLFGEIREELAGYKLSDRAAVLLLRGSDIALDADRWCESVMSVLVGQGPQHWSQNDADTMRQRLPEVLAEIVEARDSRRRLLLQRGKGGARLRRILVQGADGPVFDTVVDEHQFALMTRESKDVLKRLSRLVGSLGVGERAIVLAKLLETTVHTEESE